MLNNNPVHIIQTNKNLNYLESRLPTNDNINGEKMRTKECYLSYINTIPKWEKSNTEEFHKLVPPSIKQKKMKKRSWDLQDEYILFTLHKELGNKWSEIAHQIYGRDDNTVKNYFYCKMRKIVRMLNKGIINDEIRRNEYSVWQALYLLDHVKSNYIQVGNKELRGDKYIIEMVEKGNITENTIENYITFLINSIPPDLKKKLNFSEAKSSNSDHAFELYEESEKSYSYERKKMEKFSSLPLPSNMYNPRFKLQPLENCDYSFLGNSCLLYRSLLKKFN